MVMSVVTARVVLMGEGSGRESFASDHIILRYCGSEMQPLICKASFSHCITRATFGPPPCRIKLRGSLQIIVIPHGPGFGFEFEFEYPG